jgi:hypothetical protein
MKKLKKNSLLEVKGGDSTPFCKGVAATDIIVGGLIAFNIWNPVGWGIWAAAAVVNGYCAFG